MKMAIIETYKSVGIDYSDVKMNAELDAETNLSFINGKQYPYAIQMTTVKNKNNKINYKAEVFIFDNQLERDLFVLRQGDPFIVNFYNLNNN